MIFHEAIFGAPSALDAHVMLVVGVVVLCVARKMSPAKLLFIIGTVCLRF